MPLLKTMQKNCIDLIYMDPPYATGKKWIAPVESESSGASWGDSFKKLEENYSFNPIYESIGDVCGQEIKGLLYFLTPRLQEAKRVLKENGVIFLHCNDSIDFALRFLMNSIFGKQWYKNAIIWDKRGSQQSNNKKIRCNY